MCSVSDFALLALPPCLCTCFSCIVYPPAQGPVPLTVILHFCAQVVKESESESEVAQSCLTLCDPTDCSLAGSSVHEIFQARILGWVAISFSRGSAQPRDRTWVSHIAGRLFTI